jgi:hypothetical protein
MRHPDIDYMIVMERRRDELAEAAHYRMVKQALAASRVNAYPRLSARIGQLRDEGMLSLAHLLSMIGGRMLNWSCHLQTRYEFLSEGVAEKRVSPC